MHETPWPNLVPLALRAAIASAFPFVWLHPRGVSNKLPCRDRPASLCRFCLLSDVRSDSAAALARTPALADLIEASSARYSLARAQMAMGFSNGAIMATTLFPVRPGLMAGAVQV